jgi:hypothetical protein
VRLTNAARELFGLLDEKISASRVCLECRELGVDLGGDRRRPDGSVHAEGRPCVGDRALQRSSRCVVVDGDAAPGVGCPHLSGHEDDVVIARFEHTRLERESPGKDEERSLCEQRFDRVPIERSLFVVRYQDDDDVRAADENGGCLRFEPVLALIVPSRKPIETSLPLFRRPRACSRAATP